ncbi:MAG: RNA polymerase subunit sigma-70 [Terriglobia bacterium]|nr:MAG: RNA polymerase subunit sigma-70 [Terriglobia bacterium]
MKPVDAPQPEITQLLRHIQDGDRTAEAKLVPILYQELHRLAASYMRRERSDHTLQPTALVNEAYLKLVRIPDINWESRGHFFAVASQIMRQILVDHARAHLAAKRGGSAAKVSIDDLQIYSPEKSAELVALDEALQRLAQKDPRMCKVVELRFFAGLTFEQIGNVLKVSDKTAMRDWQVARAWLHAEVSK